MKKFYCIQLNLKEFFSTFNLLNFIIHKLEKKKINLKKLFKDLILLTGL